MDQSVAACASNDSLLVRVVRMLATGLLAICSLVLVCATRPVLQIPNAATILRMCAFVSALGMLASSVAAFWWPVASLRRVEWAAYLTLVLLVTLACVAGADGGPVLMVAPMFGLGVLTVVVARVTRRSYTAQSAACNCGH